MSNSEFGSCVFLLVLIITLAHLLGYGFTRLKQPRVVGEILAGVLLLPAVRQISQHVPVFGATGLSLAAEKNDVVLGFVYNFGLLLLMFASGAEAKGLFDNQNPRKTAILGFIGTGAPFLVSLLIFPFIPLQMVIGTANQPVALMLVISIGFAVTSIPVISKIFHDLGILGTAFGRLVLSVAVIEDIILWAVLAVATALAKSGQIPQSAIAAHIAITLTYFGVGMFLMPDVVKRLTESKWNPLSSTSPVGYASIVLLSYAALAAVFDVNLVFAAFLAGYACVAKTEKLQEAVHMMSKVAFGIFIPAYFAIVGYKLDLTRTFAPGLLAVALSVACFVKLISVGAGARLGGFRWLESVNLAMAMNARGGPGIVLASVAFDAHIINAPMYTTLVLVAVFTSQLAGAWLDFVLYKGWPLLSDDHPVGDKGIAHANGTF